MSQVADQIAQDGIAVVPAVLSAERCRELLAVIARLRACPGTFHRVLSPAGEPVVESDLFRFRDVPEIAELVIDGPLAQLAADVFDTTSVVMLEDQWFASAPGSSTSSPWHQDEPYHPLDREFLTIWLPLTPPPPGTVLRGVVGSNHGPLYAPVEFSAGQATLSGVGGRLEPVPEVDADPRQFPVLTPEVVPGDAVLLASGTLHAAGGYCGSDFVRLSIRYAHPDTCYRSRPWQVASFWDEHGWSEGDPLASGAFPIVTPA